MARKACIRYLLALIAWLALTGVSRGQEATAILVGPIEAVTAGTNVSVWMHFLNPSASAVSRTFPAELKGRISAGGKAFDAVLPARAAGVSSEVSIPAGGFVRNEYTLALPLTLPPGQAVLEASDLGVNRVVLDIRPPPPKVSETAEPPKSGFVHFLQEGLIPKKDYSGPVDFFKQHIFGYQPFYFLYGPQTPEAKFQISLRYQLLNGDGPLAQKAPYLKGLNVAYTQTSLWDMGQESSPFVDTSYKPELMYLWERVDGGRWADWIRFDLQGGLQHESNGNPEINSRLLDIGDRVSYYVEDGSGGQRIKTSRSLNILYLWPTVTFGKTDGLQLAVSPRVWTYVGDLDDNPDLPNYRGYADLKLVAGWAKGLQLSATGRLGDDGNKGSLQLDLSYPLMKLFSGSLSVYLYAQYFTGYGESLLLYDRRSEAVRFGFALYR
jgi:phospholipase A1/A2